ncbi:MAG: hypothetical protein ACKO70_10840 [Actinomycetota bacterium]
MSFDGELDDETLAAVAGGVRPRCNMVTTATGWRCTGCAASGTGTVAGVSCSAPSGPAMN